MLGIIITISIALCAGGAMYANENIATSDVGVNDFVKSTTELIEACNEVRESCEKLKSEYGLSNKEIENIVDIVYLYD